MEVLRLVFEREADPATLAVCARVCRSWHEAAAALLWRGSPDQMSPWRSPACEVLVGLAAKPDRFKHYIKYVQHLVLLWEDFAGAGVPGLFEPDLWSEFQARSVTVDIGSENMGEDAMTLLLSPQLRVFWLYGGFYQKKFIQTLANRAPQLRWVLLDNHEDVGTSSLWEFLQKARHLKALELSFGLNHMLQTVDVMALILDMNLLLLDLSAPQDMREHDIPVFPSTSDKTLDFTISSVQVDAFAKLVALFPSLKHLDCSVTGDTIDFAKQILPTILDLKDLSEVQLRFNSWAQISFDSLAETKTVQHGNTRQLEIWIDLDEEERELDHRAPEDTLALLSEFFPRLEVLIFDYPCDIHDSELQAVANSCPQLRELSVAANVDLVHHFEKLSITGFPRLEKASFAAASILDSSKDGIDNAASLLEQLERLVRNRAPLLSSLDFTAGSEAVVYRFNSLLRSLNRKLAAAARPRTTTSRNLRHKLLEEVMSSSN